MIPLGRISATCWSENTTASITHSWVSWSLFTSMIDHVAVM